MSIYIVLLVLISLTCGSAPEAVEASWRSVTASLLMVAGWALLAHLGARILSRQFLAGKLSVDIAVKYMHWQMEILRWLALPVVVLCLWGFSLAAWTRQQPVLESLGIGQAIVLLTPGLLLVMSTWSAEYIFGAIIGWNARSLRSYFNAMWGTFRHGPAWLIGPTFVLLGLMDLVAWAETTSLLENSRLDPAMVALSILVGGGAAVLILLPWGIRLVFRTQPMSAEHQMEIRNWLTRLGVSSHRVLGMKLVRWDTGGQMLNALVAGILPMGRLLVLSDRLLDELPAAQRLMVVMHEMAHVRRWHIPIRMAAVMPAWFVSTWVGSWLGDYSWGAVAGGMSGLVTTIVALGLASQWSELDADRVACRLAVRACGDSDSPIEMTEALAANTLAQALSRVGAGHPQARRLSWLHPSLTTRIERLQCIGQQLEETGAVGGSACEAHTLGNSNQPIFPVS